MMLLLLLLTIISIITQISHDSRKPHPTKQESRSCKRSCCCFLRRGLRLSALAAVTLALSLALSTYLICFSLPFVPLLRTIHSQGSGTSETKTNELVAVPSVGRNALAHKPIHASHLTQPVAPKAYPFFKEADEETVMRNLKKVVCWGLRTKLNIDLV